MKISLITVCYNSAKTIVDTLASVAAQTHPNIEHIIIDGGSSDGTQTLVKQNGTHIKFFLSEPDNGIYDAMNKGIAAASGEIIGFINADDCYATNDALTKVAAIFADKDMEACYGSLCYVRQHDTSKIVRYWKASEFRPGAFESGWCPAHPTFFARRVLFEKFGGFDLRYRIAADFELMLRFLEVHKVRAKCIHDILVNMRMGGTTNRSMTNIVMQNREIMQALRAHGLRASLALLIGNKLIKRGGQFFLRPKRGERG